jgi:hypothetical protein
VNERCFLRVFAFLLFQVQSASLCCSRPDAGGAGGSRSGVHNGGRFCGPCSGGAGGSKNLELVVYNNSERQLFY